MIEEIEVRFTNREPAVYTLRIFELLLEDETVESIVSMATGEVYFYRPTGYISRDFYSDWVASHS